MKSQLFPQLDRHHVERLLRSGLTISTSQTNLIHAARRLAELSILHVALLDTVRCVNPDDEDFPDDVVNERCSGVIRLSQGSQSSLPYSPVYDCPSCGRIIEYPGVAKQIFQIWYTEVNQSGLKNYRAKVHSALGIGASAHFVRMLGLTEVDMLTRERQWITSRVHQAQITNHTQHTYRADLHTLRNSFLEAFPTKPQFAQMLRVQLDINLDAIALGDNLTEIVDKVIMSAEAEGWLSALCQGAHRANPNNERLRELLPDVAAF